MNSVRMNNFSPLSITTTDFHLLGANIQDRLKDIEEIAIRMNREFEAKKNHKWWKYPDQKVLFKLDLNMNVLENAVKNASLILKKAELLSNKVENESLIYRIIHKITGVL